MPNISRSNFPAELLEGIKRNFGVGYAENKMFHMDFFDVENSKKEVERYQEMIPLGLHAVKPEGVNSTLDDVGQGPTTFIENIAYALAYEITHEALEDNLYPQILKQALDLGRSARQTKETVVLDRLNTGFSTAPADIIADGQALFSTAHPLSGTGGETNQNRPTVAASLSEASLTIDIANIRKFQDPKGNRINVDPVMLFVPVELEVTAWKLLNTELSVGTANNDLNPMRVNAGTGFFAKQSASSPYLIDPDAYFIRTNVDGLVYQTREEARIMEDVKNRAMVQEVVSYQRFGVEAYDFRSTYGNPGS